MLSTLEYQLLRGTNKIPAIPTRDQVCNVFEPLQGSYFTSTQYGRITQAELTSTREDDAINIARQVKALGFTHAELTISWNYYSGIFPYPGIDLTKDLAEFKLRILNTIKAGLFCDIALAMDGDSVKVDGKYIYNDPIGWTYGWQWGMDNLPYIINYLRSGIDVTPYCIFRPGWDGCFYGWSDANPKVIAFGKLFRELLPNGYLAIEHTTGNIPIGNGEGDWITNGSMEDYDTLLSEFDPWNYKQDSTWQVLARCHRPYVRPSDQPEHDDPNPPFYLLPSTKRGKRHYSVFEIFIYKWVRNQMTPQEYRDGIDYFRSMSPGATICSL